MQTGLFAEPEFYAEGSIAHVSEDTMVSGLEGMEDRSLKLYKLKVARIINHLTDIGLPAPGEQFRLITRRTWNAAAVLQYIIDSGERIEDLRLVVYSINYDAARLITQLINRGEIARAEILISNLRNTAASTKERVTQEMFQGHPKIDIWYASSHAKVMSCRTDRGNHYHVEGSANLSYNSRIEQYVIDNDPALYDFTTAWMREIRDYLRKHAKKELIEPNGPSED